MTLSFVLDKNLAKSFCFFRRSDAIVALQSTPRKINLGAHQALARAYFPCFQMNDQIQVAPGLGPKI